jgi:hypothetical protein
MEGYDTTKQQLCFPGRRRVKDEYLEFGEDGQLLLGESGKMTGWRRGKQGKAKMVLSGTGKASHV